MTPQTIPVFLNGRPARAIAGATLSQLVAQEDMDLSRALEAGQARATDARGIDVPTNTLLSAGAIFRVFLSARTAGSADA